MDRGASLANCCVHTALWSSDRRNNLLRAYDGTGVVRQVDVERGVHHLVRVIRRRVLHHGDVIAELSGKANGCFDTGVRDQPDDDELMDAVLLELQIEVGVGEAAGAPVLLSYDFTRLRRELGAELAAPRAEFEAPMLPCALLNRRNVFPRFVVARAGFLQKNRAAMVDFMEDSVRVVRWYLDPKNHDETVQIAARLTKLRPELFAGWLFTSKEYLRSPDLLPDLAALQSNIDVQRDLGFLKRPIDVQTYADLSLVREAAQRLK